MADVARIEELLDEVEQLADPAARETALELVQALLDLYGEGLARVVEHADDGLVANLADDELVGHLLVLHGLHPVSLEARVRGALEQVRPYLESHGGDVELLGVEDGVARLALQGSCSGCPSSTATLKLAIEDAVHKAAPDVERIEAEGAVEQAPALLQLGVSEALRGSWTTAGGVEELVVGSPVLREVAGEAVLFLGVDGGAYAYRPTCPSCGGSLEGGTLRGAELACAGCDDRYDVRRAGRSLDAPDLHLDPVPLLMDAGVVKVALEAPAVPS
jgi:Fe-S cluster biogenesis protein NfuA/nitrite reductase/ring-hydroxylating ferredoxin subunit